MKSFGLDGLQLHPKLTDLLFYTRLKSKPQMHTILTTQQFKTTTILQVLVYHQASGKYLCEEAESLDMPNPMFIWQSTRVYIAVRTQ